jgi:hypothetical protein
MTTFMYFHNIPGVSVTERCVPYILDQESVEYTLEGSGGSICFDGHYYVEDHGPPYPEDDALEPWRRPNRYRHWLPATIEYTFLRREMEPYKTDVDEHGSTTSFYKTLERRVHRIEVYKREIHHSTDRMSTLDDSDGEEMTVCFFPSNKQTIWFRVLEDLTPPTSEWKPMIITE